VLNRASSFASDSRGDSAAFRASEQVCRLLVNAGAQGVDSPDQWGNKPSALAEKTGRRKSKEYLQTMEGTLGATLAAVKMKSKIKSKEMEPTGM